MRIIKQSKTTMVSSILNILGLTAAFAALYIILVQVHHDLSFNKSLKDSDRIYVLTKRKSTKANIPLTSADPWGSMLSTLPLISKLVAVVKS